MGQTAATVFSGAGVGFAANASLRAGKAAQEAGDFNAAATINEADYNARVATYNAKVAELQAQDAIARGQIAESTARASTASKVGAIRADYGAQGVNVDVGSPAEVVRSVASGGALDAMTVRLNAAREAWGFSVQAASERSQSEAIRQKGSVDAWNAKTQGNVARSAGRNQAAATILGGAGQLIRERYGARRP